RRGYRGPLPRRHVLRRRPAGRPRQPGLGRGEPAPRDAAPPHALDPRPPGRRPTGRRHRRPRRVEGAGPDHAGGLTPHGRRSVPVLVVLAPAGGSWSLGAGAAALAGRGNSLARRPGRPLRCGSPPIPCRRDNPQYAPAASFGARSASGLIGYGRHPLSFQGTTGARSPMDLEALALAVDERVWSPAAERRSGRLYAVRCHSGAGADVGGVVLELLAEGEARTLPQQVHLP